MTGTDASSRLGGIGVVMEGYLAALQEAGIAYAHVPTYHPGAPHGRWLPWLRGLPRVWALARDSRRAGARAVVFSHAGDGVSLLRESVVLWVGRLAGARTLQQVHSPKVDGYLEKALARGLFKFALVPADRVGVLTSWWEARLRGAGVRRPLSVIANPLPPPLEEVARRPLENHTGRRAHAGLRVLTMARLVEGKGVDVVLRAMSHLPDTVRLRIAGDGSERARLEDLARDLGLAGRVEFLGWVSGEAKRRLLEEADVFCLPSTYDAFPMSMVEAMAYGLPVVAVRWGGIPDLVADGETGRLAEAPSVEGIAQALLEMMDAGRREDMGRRAKARILKISSREVVAERLRTVLGTLLAQPAEARSDRS